MSRRQREPNAIVWHALRTGLLKVDSATKQRLGQFFAEKLGFEAGPRGPDAGIDGEVHVKGRRVHFQCKLESKPLGRGYASQYCREVKAHGFDASILLSGSGYGDGFFEQVKRLGPLPFEARYLTLEDLYYGSDQLKEAARLLPVLKDFGGGWPWVAR